MKLKQRIKAAAKAFRIGTVEVSGKHNMEVFTFPELADTDDSGKGNIFQLFHVPPDRGKLLEDEIRKAIMEEKRVPDAVARVSKHCHNPNELAVAAYMCIAMAEKVNRNPLVSLLKDMFK